MDTSTAVFVAIWVIFVCMILFTLFTKKGKSIFAQLTFGGEIVKDYGDIGQTTVMGMTQKLSLSERSSGKENYFVLGVRTSGSFSFIKIPQEAAQNFVKAVSSANKDLPK